MAAGAAHLQLVPGRADVGAQRGRAALPGPEPEEGTKGTGTSQGTGGLCCLMGCSCLLSPFSEGTIFGGAGLCWGRDGLVWWLVLMPGGGFGAQQSDAFYLAFASWGRVSDPHGSLSFPQRPPSP